MPSSASAGQDWAAQEWAEIIRKGATDPDVVIAAINALTMQRQANRGAVMVACAWLLAQSIVSAGTEDAAVIRSGIMALIDGFATKVAVGAE